MCHQDPFLAVHNQGGQSGQQPEGKGHLDIELQRHTRHAWSSDRDNPTVAKVAQVSVAQRGSGLKAPQLPPLFPIS